MFHWNRNIKQMIFWLLHLPILSAFTYTLFRTMRGEFANWVFFGALALRVLAGLSAAVTFSYIYPANDSISFFEMSQSILRDHSVWEVFFLEKSEFPASSSPRVIFFVKILSFFTFISGESYWIVTLYFSFISFLSSWFFVREMVKLFPTAKILIVIGFLFIPSIAFWSSGVLKDTLSYAALLLVVISILKTSKSVRVSIPEFILTLFAIFILLKIKHYLLITALIFSGLTLCVYFFKKFNNPWKWASLLLPIIFFFSTQFIHPYLKVNRIAQTIFETNQAILKKTDRESHVGIEIENEEWLTIIREAPNALFTGLFRPSFFDNTPPLGLIHKIENFLLLSLCIFSLLLLIREKPPIDWGLIVPSFLAIMMLASLLALTTPNLGTLIRYKNVLMPFLFLLSSYLPYQHLTSKKD